MLVRTWQWRTLLPFQREHLQLASGKRKGRGHIYFIHIRESSFQPIPLFTLKPKMKGLSCDPGVGLPVLCPAFICKDLATYSSIEFPTPFLLKTNQKTKTKPNQQQKNPNWTVCSQGTTCNLTTWEAEAERSGVRVIIGYIASLWPSCYKNIRFEVSMRDTRKFHTQAQSTKTVQDTQESPFDMNT